MKKILAALTAVLILFASAALAEDLASLSDAELLILHQSVLDELERRGISGGEEEMPYTVGEESGEAKAVTSRLVEFFMYWSRSDYDSMATLCASDWKARLENPRTALFALAANRTPQNLVLESLSGDDTDPVRKVQVTSYLDRNNGTAPQNIRMRITMIREEDGLWYVDPAGLATWEPAEETPDFQPTPEPGETADTTADSITDSTLLYYNPEGGSFYHLDPDCRRVHPNFRPLEACFTVAELNDEAYRDLEPCAVCGAPLRTEAPENETDE